MLGDGANSQSTESELFLRFFFPNLFQSDTVGTQKQRGSDLLTQLDVAVNDTVLDLETLATTEYFLHHLNLDASVKLQLLRILSDDEKLDSFYQHLNSSGTSTLNLVPEANGTDQEQIRKDSMDRREASGNVAPRRTMTTRQASAPAKSNSSTKSKFPKPSARSRKDAASERKKGRDKPLKTKEQLERKKKNPHPIGVERNIEKHYLHGKFRFRLSVDGKSMFGPWRDTVEEARADLKKFRRK